MEGFILAAGLGQRLQPLTNDMPKALVDVGGKPLLEHVIGRLVTAGVAHIVINVHHFADKIEEFVGSKQWGCTINFSDERSQLLDTGGGLKHAARFFSGRENILVHNVDILSDIDLCDVERQHRTEGNLVTLCVSERESYTKRLLEFSSEGLLMRRAEQGLAFSGVSVVSPALFPLLPEDDHPYQIVDEYVRLSQEGYRIGSYRHSGKPEHWIDVGKQESLDKAREIWTPSFDK